MFNDKYGLTQAVLEGRKTQTRRTFLKPGEEFLSYGITPAYLISARSRYKLDETIAIAQKYADLAYDGEFFRLLGKVIFKKGCHNNMFVKADLMPHRIRITNIRVERLQDISEADCLKEGIWRDNNVGLEGTTYWYHGLANSSYRTARDAYAALIDKISGKGTWENNPWVFVYDFKLVK